MSNLITPVEFATYRDISKKLDEDKINEAIGLAEESDLIDILGDFYFDVDENKDSPEWQPLMAGGGFEYCGKNYKHKGIKALLADYTYARFVYMGNVNLTAFGIGTKNYQDSKPIERNHIKDLAKQAQKDAGVKFKYIEYYILSKPELFDRYCQEKNPTNSFGSIKITKL